MRALMRSPPWAVVLTAFLVSSCGDHLTTTPPTDDLNIVVSIVSGEGQVWYAGHELQNPVVVKVTYTVGKAERPVANHQVNFRVVEGGGHVYAGSAHTDNFGIAQEYWTLGPEVGANVLEVRSVDPSTGEKQLWGNFTATGEALPEGFTIIRDLLTDAWVLEVVDRLEPDVASDLRAAFEVAIDGFEKEVLDFDAVESALATAKGLVTDAGPPNIVEFAFLDLIVSHARTLFDNVMQTIIVAPATEEHQ
jgi:hypothetical protein